MAFTKLEWPIQPASVMLFISFLDLSGYAPKTIISHLSAIAYPHKLGGWSDPTQAFTVRKLITAVQKRDVSKDPKLPITLTLLHKMLDRMDVILSKKEAALYKAVFSLSFHLCARIGEVSVSSGNQQNVITVENTNFTRKNGKLVKITVHFTKFKHKTTASPAIRVVNATNDKWCPVLLLHKYLQYRGQENRKSRNSREKKTLGVPVFLSTKGLPLRSSQVASVLREVLESLGLDHRRYSTHGFRIGGTTEAAKKGASDTQLRLLGRWRSNAFLSYVRPHSVSFQF